MSTGDSLHINGGHSAESYPPLPLLRSLTGTPESRRETWQSPDLVTVVARVLTWREKAENPLPVLRPSFTPSTVSLPPVKLMCTKRKCAGIRERMSMIQVLTANEKWRYSVVLYLFWLVKKGIDSSRPTWFWVTTSVLCYILVTNLIFFLFDRANNGGTRWTWKPELDWTWIRLILPNMLSVCFLFFALTDLL